MKRFLLTASILLFCGLSGCAPSVNVQQQAKSHYTLGVSHLQSGNPTFALKELLQAVKINPQNDAYHAALARAYQFKKSFPDAEKHYLKALELSDGDPRYQNNLAALYLDMGLWDKAIERFNKAAENLLFMRTEVALIGAGFAYFRKGDFPSAMKAYREAENIAPGYYMLHLRKGEVLLAMDQVDQAEQAFQRALEIAPQYLEAHYQMGLLHLRQKNYQLAKEEFVQVKELAPDSKWGQKAREFLKTMP